jgi:hypothetical protein
METKDFLKKVALGESSEAKEALDEILSNKAFQALEEKKKEIAQSYFGVNEAKDEEEKEEDEDEDEKEDDDEDEDDKEEKK